MFLRFESSQQDIKGIQFFIVSDEVFFVQGEEKGGRGKLYLIEVVKLFIVKLYVVKIIIIRMFVIMRVGKYFKECKVLFSYDLVVFGEEVFGKREV